MDQFFVETSGTVQLKKASSSGSEWPCREVHDLVPNPHLNSDQSGPFNTFYRSAEASCPST